MNVDMNSQIIVTSVKFHQNLRPKSQNKTVFFEYGPYIFSINQKTRNEIWPIKIILKIFGASLYEQFDNFHSKN